MLEENITVLVSTTSCRMLWVQCMCTELFNCVHRTHIFQIFIIPFLNLLNLMGGTETIKEVDERYFTL